MRAYSYQCRDYSLLTPVFKKIFVNPVIGFIPWGVPANMITIISNSFFYWALYLSFNPSILGKSTYLVIPALLLAYLIGDHLDGAQAKRTKTGSALGEFCDHYLDAFNNGILMLILFNLFHIQHPWIMVGVLITSYWAHVVVFYEQFKTGWLIFEKLGSLEGVLIAIAMILASYIEPIYSIFISEAFFGIMVMEFILILIALGAIVTMIKTLQRTPEKRYSIWMFIVILGFIGIVGQSLFTPWSLAIIITLYASQYLGKVMMGHLVDGIERSPGLFTPLFILIISMAPNFYSGNTFLIITFYLLVTIILIVYRTFQPLKQYWVWVNPKLEDEKSR